MKRFTAILFALLLLAWLATGLFVVRGNEKAAVRRFGRVQRNAGGNVVLRASGLHWDLPWPFATVDRVNLGEVHTVSIGQSELEGFSDARFLQVVDPSAESRYLTGDKNILNVKFGVQYRIAEEQVDAFLYENRSADRSFASIKSAVEQRLRTLAQGVFSDLVTRSGVDFVHTQGRAMLQELLTDRLRDLALKQRLGIRVDTVTLEVVEPPLRVRAAFLDVNDARADKEKYVNAASAYAAEREAAASADASQIRNEAEIVRRQTVERAKAEADSFVQLVQQFRPNGQPGTPQQETARRIAMQRLYLETMEQILSRVKAKVFLQSGKPVDLTFPREMNR